MAVQCGTQWPEQETNVYGMAMFKKGENKPSKSKKKSGIFIPNYHTSWNLDPLVVLYQVTILFLY
jgi:hypothetical protein